MEIKLAWWEFLGILGVGVLLPSPLTKGKGESKMSEVIGIKETQELVLAVVAVAKGIKEAKESGNGFGAEDLGVLLKIAPAVKDGVLGLEKLPSELKDLDADEVKKLATEALGGIAADGKVKLYVEEAFGIIGSVYRIIKA